MYDELLPIIGQSMGILLALGIYAFIILLAVAGILGLVLIIRGFYRWLLR